MTPKEKFMSFINKEKKIYNWDAPTSQPPKPRYIPKVKDPNLWEIRKRSLPEGIDQVVMDGLRMPMASNIWKNSFTTKRQDNGKVIYYDLVREDGTKAGIYDNDVKLTVDK